MLLLVLLLADKAVVYLYWKLTKIEVRPEIENEIHVLKKLSEPFEDFWINICLQIHLDLRPQ